MNRPWKLCSLLSVLIVSVQTGPLCAQPLFHAQTPKLDKRLLPSKGNKLQARVTVSIVKPRDTASKKDELKSKKETEKQVTAVIPPKAKTEPAKTPGNSTATDVQAQDKAADAEVHSVPSDGTAERKSPADAPADRKAAEGQATATTTPQAPPVLAMNVNNDAMRALTATAQERMREQNPQDPNLTAGTSFNFARLFGWGVPHVDNRHHSLNGHSQMFRGLTYQELVTTYGITGLMIASDRKYHHQVVTYVFPTTPAGSSAIRPGDVLLMANDHLFYGDEGQVEVWRVITGPPHTKVDMIFSRKGTKFKVTLNRMNIEEIPNPRARFYFQRCFRQLGALNTTGN